MNDDCLIVSVESRKGGVGKTTAALNLARILLEKRGHAVLFLDIDITGTNVCDCIDSPFWKDICHFAPDTARNKPRTVNLLEIFERQFMSGLGTPQFAEKPSTSNGETEAALLLVPDKINVIGSQIFNLNRPATGNRDTCISKPGILFDDLHAFWFIEFLQSICTSFYERIRKDNPSRPVAVILDNSPGYVGFSPAIQEWLTDLGPKRGKFLTISSLDQQDLLSCGRALDNLHGLYARKWCASRRFREATNHNGKSCEEFQLARDEESFFLRLAEIGEGHGVIRKTSDGVCGVSGTDLAFYIGENQDSGEWYSTHAESYLGLVINRVPRLVKRGVYTYDAEQMYSLMHPNGSGLVSHLLESDRGGHAQWMVSYDESIEYQFLQPMISRRRGRMSRREQHIEQVMFVIGERGSVPSDEMLQAVLNDPREMHPSVLDEVRRYLRTADEAVAAVIRLVEQFGFSYLTDLIQDEWLPRNVHQDFRIALQNALLDTGFPFVELELREVDKEHIGPEAWHFVERLRADVERHVLEKKVGVSLKVIDQFLPSLAVVVALSVNPRWWHSPLEEELPALVGYVAGIEALHWEQRPDRRRKRQSIQGFLASETTTTRKEWEKLRHELRIHPRWLEYGGFSHLYQACASAQARLIDVRRDAEFLIAVVQRLVMEDIQEGPILPYVRGVAEKVIVRKSLSHESGRRTISHGFSSSQYMEEFCEVLEKVLVRWERQQ